MKQSKNPYQKHLFVCINKRDSGKTSCAENGEAICEKLKTYCKEHGLKGKVRISRSGCFDFCAKGPNVLVFPDYICYSELSLEDVDMIIKEHLLKLHQ
ncbi:MAG: (2Fe-2S) ferredoxin domain-containing protein [Chlamydiota bacterium]|nr:(2Fe-2S) ferredoxin domain-containing protein [Chlamydiota bacterium]